MPVQRTIKELQKCQLKGTSERLQSNLLLIVELLPTTDKTRHNTNTYNNEDTEPVCVSDLFQNCSTFILKEFVQVFNRASLAVVCSPCPSLSHLALTRLLLFSLPFPERGFQITSQYYPHQIKHTQHPQTVFSGMCCRSLSKLPLLCQPSLLFFPILWKWEPKVQHYSSQAFPSPEMRTEPKNTRFHSHNPM